MLNVIYVARNKKPIMLYAFMLNVVMLNVVMLNVVAPQQQVVHSQNILGRHNI
jgi:hypothetical protein